MEDYKKHFTAALFLVYIITDSYAAGTERFVEEPESKRVAEGQDHMLRCTIEDRQGEVQWLRDGFGLGPGTEFEGYPRYRITQNTHRGEFHLLINNIQLEDDALFECQVGATQWSTGLKSRRARLTVQIPPDIVSIEGSPRLSVVSGQSHVLVCQAANGKPAPAITWQRQGARLFKETVNYTARVQADGKRVDALSQLTILPSRTDQDVEYSCHATSPAMSGLKSAKVQLEVLYKPEVTMSVSPTRLIREFQSLTVVCTAVGNPPTTSWRWFRGNDELPNQTSNRLDLTEVTRDQHRQRLSCQATNSVGSSRQVHVVNIEYGPRFVSEPPTPSADLGDTVSISCDVDSNPPADIVWRRKGSNRVLSSESLLHIPIVTDEHFTTFTCTASVNGYREVVRDVAVLKRGPPRIISEPNQMSRVGETGTVECLVESVPKPDRIAWSKDEKVMTFGDNINRYRVREEDTRNGRRSIIEISMVEDGDFGQYNCTAENSYGADHATIRFTKKEVLPLPYILAGVLAAVVLLIVAIVAAVFVYRRKRKTTDSDSNSRSSTDSVSVKKMGNVPTITLEYSTPTEVDRWRDSLPEEKFPNHSAEYDELRYPTKDLTFPGLPNYYGSRPNGHHDYTIRAREPYVRPTYSNENLYGTYPRGMTHPYNQRVDGSTYGIFYGSDTYASYGRLPYRDNRTPSFVPPPPASPTESKLSTNV